MKTTLSESEVINRFHPTACNILSDYAAYFKEILKYSYKLGFTEQPDYELIRTQLSEIQAISNNKLRKDSISNMLQDLRR